MDDSVWVDTTNGGLLRQLFGHYPTLHQARMITLEVDRAADRVSADIEYVDEPDSGDAPLRVRMRLEWHGVKSADLWFQGNEIMTVRFDRTGRNLVTTFAPCSGTQGSIVADRFEAILTQAQALPTDAEGIRLKIK